eukprot:6183717-Pleurochrysis_carterae.AAC.1
MHAATQACLPAREQQQIEVCTGQHICINLHRSYVCALKAIARMCEFLCSRVVIAVPSAREEAREYCQRACGRVYVCNCAHLHACVPARTCLHVPLHIWPYARMRKHTRKNVYAGVWALRRTRMLAHMHTFARTSGLV